MDYGFLGCSFFHSLSPLLRGVLGCVVQSDFLGCLLLSFIHYHGWKGMVE